jgi:hypothetical protein
MTILVRNKPCVRVISRFWINRYVMFDVGERYYGRSRIDIDTPEIYFEPEF